MISKKKSICFILSHFGLGGAEVQTLNLIRGLIEKNFKITLLLYKSDEIYFDALKKMPIKIVVRSTAKTNKFLEKIDQLFFIHTYLKKNSFDLIHTLLFHNGFWVRLVLPKKYYNKILYSVRNDIKNIPRWILFFERFFIKFSFIVTNSLNSYNQINKFLKNNFSNKIHNIYNGIDIDKFLNTNKKKFNNNKVLIGNVGRVTFQKNQIQLIRIMNKMERGKFKLNIVGDKSGDQRTYNILIESIKNNDLSENALLLDPSKNIEELYKNFDLFILTSYYEGCPNAIMEAMLSKCICIISRNSNYDRFIIDSHNGYEYDGTDSDLIKKINKFLDLDLDSKEKMINSAIDYVKSNFSMHIMVNNYDLFYDKILNENFTNK